MSLHFLDCLHQWFPLRNKHRWVLGAVSATSGSVYRKTGALMLLSDAGHQLGLLSGGCLESDLLLQARKIMALGGSKTIVYDASDEDGIAWRLGIGCGGRAEILLQSCAPENQFLQLEAVRQYLEQGDAVQYQLGVDSTWAQVKATDKCHALRIPGRQTENAGSACLQMLINPPPHLLIFGSGVDVVPVAALANTLGWRVTLIDHRLSPQKRTRFPAEITTISAAAQDLPVEILKQADAAFVAYHNLQLDAAALVALQVSSCRYLGLLGPGRRKEEVLSLAGLNGSELRIPAAGPAGLALGGDLPESVALSVLAEAHAVLFGSNAKPLSNVYFPA